MSMILPVLRMTQRETLSIQQELTPIIEQWLSDWCVVAPDFSVKTIELSKKQIDLAYWGSGVFWLATDAEDKWQPLLHSILFETQPTSAQMHPAALAVIKKAKLALLGNLLNVNQITPLTPPPSGLKGMTVSIEFVINYMQMNILLSPAVVMDILETNCYVKPQAKWHRFSDALAQEEQSFEAVIGEAELPLQSFVELNEGDVITLDLNRDAVLRNRQKAFATIIPCRSKQQTAILIKAFKK